jgi:hypothetical protein
MVEQKSRTGKKSVRIPVIGDKRNGSGFSDAVRAFWMVSGALICRVPLRIAEYLRRPGIVEPDVRFFEP